MIINLCRVWILHLNFCSIMIEVSRNRDKLQQAAKKKSPEIEQCHNANTSSKLLQRFNANESLVLTEEEINYEVDILLKAFAKFSAEALKGPTVLRRKKKIKWFNMFTVSLKRRFSIFGVIVKIHHIKKIITGKAFLRRLMGSSKFSLMRF